MSAPTYLKSVQLLDKAVIFKNAPQKGTIAPKMSANNHEAVSQALFGSTRRAVLALPPTSASAGVWVPWWRFGGWCRQGDRGLISEQAPLWAEGNV